MSQKSKSKPTAKQAVQVLLRYRNADKAQIFKKFFKSGPGEYAEGDRFLGVTVPQVRTVSRTFSELPEDEIEVLIRSDWHEARLLALVVMVNRFKKSGKLKDLELREQIQKGLFKLYTRNLQFVNNWDLVDVSAEHIVGAWLFSRDRKTLETYARSPHLWTRRVSIMSTFYFIRKGDFSTTLVLAKQLLNDKHDLIHKAVGWLIREVGKRDLDLAENFLETHAARMPRTMLRYAIEKLRPAKREFYLRLSKEKPLKARLVD